MFWQMLKSNFCGLSGIIEVFPKYGEMGKRAVDSITASVNLCGEKING